MVGFRGTLTLIPEAFTSDNDNFQVGRYTLTAKTTLDIIAGIYPD